MFLDLSQRIFSLHLDGKSLSHIARTVGCAKSTVHKWIQRGKAGEDLKHRPRSGRPKRDISDAVRQAHALNPRSTSLRDIRSHVEPRVGPVALGTISRALHDLDLKAFRTFRKPMLTEDQQRRRLEWAQEFCTKPASYWRKVMFTDEKMCVLFKPTKFRWCSSREEAMEPAVSHSPKVMFHGGISYKGKTPLTRIEGKFNSEKYIKVLEDSVLPTGDELYGNKWVFQQDSTGSGIHGAKKVTALLKSNAPSEIRPWPANSPDLNPIENCWAKLSSAVVKRRPTTVKQLWKMVEEEWDNLSMNYIRKLIDSMPNRLQKVIDAGGKHTKY